MRCLFGSIGMNEITMEFGKFENFGVGVGRGVLDIVDGVHTNDLAIKAVVVLRGS